MTFCRVGEGRIQDPPQPVDPSTWNRPKPTNAGKASERLCDIAECRKGIVRCCAWVESTTTFGGNGKRINGVNITECVIIIIKTVNKK